MHTSIVFALVGCFVAVSLTFTRVQSVMSAEQDFALNSAASIGSDLLDGTLLGVDRAVEASVREANVLLPRAEITSDHVEVGVYDASGDPPYQVVSPSASNASRINALSIRY
jgi:hypothetical protein